jgi:hypothetical protein
VLALRSKLKESGWVRDAAKSAGVPVYVIKNSSTGTLTKALTAVLGGETSGGVSLDEPAEVERRVDPNADLLASIQGIGRSPGGQTAVGHAAWMLQLAAQQNKTMGIGNVWCVGMESWNKRGGDK